jgi:nitrite reductase/ring-hydroxylating ferredoxin subunit
MGLNDLMLGAVLVLIGAGAALVLLLYALPGAHLELSALDPVVRVASVEDFPIGSSRMVQWGDRAILVVRPTETDYFATSGTAPHDGCLLRWEDAASRIVSPCSYAVFDVRGNVVTGLTTTALTRYGVFVRDGSVYVTEG